MKLVFIVLAALVACTCAEVDVEKYLSQFGYHNPNAFSGHNVSTALLSYQQAFDLPQTGVADAETLKLMQTPRCGLSDGSRHLAYADTAWRKKALTYYFHNYTPDLSQSAIRSLTVRALKYWSDVTPLQFSERQGGDIVIAFGGRSHRDNRRTCRSNFDGKSGVLAHAFFPPDGRLHFDEDEHYTQGTSSGTNYLWVATHELGHILGLEHDTRTKDAVMYPYYRGYKQDGVKLHYSDRSRIQRLYGVGTGGTGTGGGRTPAPPSGCSDRVNDCYKHKANCNSQQADWKKYIESACRKTCNKCGTGGTGTGGGSCTNKHVDCYKWKNYCNTPNWKDYLDTNCNKLCGCRRRT